MEGARLARALVNICAPRKSAASGGDLIINSSIATPRPYSIIISLFSTIIPLPRHAYIRVAFIRYFSRSKTVDGNFATITLICGSLEADYPAN